MKPVLQAIEHPSFERLHNKGCRMPFHLSQAVLESGYQLKKMAFLHVKLNNMKTPSGNAECSTKLSVFNKIWLVRCWMASWLLKGTLGTKALHNWLGWLCRFPAFKDQGVNRNDYNKCYLFRTLITWLKIQHLY